MNENQPAHALNNMAGKAERPKVFRVNYIDNATGEKTPITSTPVGYDEAMKTKAAAEQSGKYDLRKGYFAALKLTDEEYDRYVAKGKSTVAEPIVNPLKGQKGAPAQKEAEAE